MSEQIKFCVDCAFFTQDTRSFNGPSKADEFNRAKFARCNRPNPERKTEGYVYISQEVRDAGLWESYNYCRTERESEHLCGSGAKFFQVKPPAVES